MPISSPKAIRVKTSTGWVDLAIQGPPGTPGYPDTTGKQGQVLTVPTPAAAPIWQAPAPGSDLNYDGDFAAGPTYKDGEIVVYQDASGNKVAYICVTPTSSPPTPWPGGPPPVPAYPRPTYGTTLPASPTDGQEHVLVDSVTAPTYQWHFRYNASSGFAQKWEFVGGAPMQSYVAAGDSTSSTALVEPATQQRLAIPRSGVYDIGFNVEIYASVQTGGDQIAVVGLTSGSPYAVTNPTSPTAYQAFGTGDQQRQGVGAAETIALKFMVITSGTLVMRGRRVTVSPVRV